MATPAQIGSDDSMTTDLSLTPADLARRWNISSRTILNLVKRGELRGTRIGHQLRFTEAEAEDYERRQAAPAPLCAPSEIAS